MKWLIVTGDDFGLTPGVNRGILEAHRLGILTSASLMVNRPASEAAAILARQYPALRLGLHLELPTDHPERGDAEIERPVTRLEELAGVHPTQLDAHHTHHPA